MNSICIDAEHGFIRSFVVAPQIVNIIMYVQILNLLASVLKIYLALLDLKIGTMRKVQEITL